MSGCTFSGVRPVTVAAVPKASPATIIIGDIKAADALWEPYRLQFSRGAADWLRRNGTFASVLTEQSSEISGTAIVLVGTITEVDKGSTALRLLVGMGAGQAKVKGEFEIQNATDRAVLVRFSSRESYLGGVGIGGAGFLDMDDLVKRFAESVAETAVKWVKGERIE
jgi:hypothetical protein